MNGFSRVEHVGSTGSTNADLVALADSSPQEWPHLSVLAARHQTAGRGRAGRAWEAEPGTALTASILLRLDVPPERTSWVPLVTALAVMQALTDLGAPAATKWPNDVLLLGAGTESIPGWGRARKVAGILVEVTPRTRGIVVGTGVDVRHGSAPVEWSASLADVGLDVTPEEVLQGIGVHLPGLVDRLAEADGDAEAAGLSSEVTDSMLTLRKRVRVALPDGSQVLGQALRLDPDGALVVRQDNGTEQTVISGDVTHVRLVNPETPPA